ncbi:MAG: AAA-like domain-containing protein [Pseudorhodoplanes sp.]|nr:AAA-like domain-containing protein [Pseudorhodoplanes sp.]
MAKSPFVVAEICYPTTAQPGVLIHIKSTMVKGLDFAAEGYRAINVDFPHQTTTDQFFDPDQFETYRDLGKKSCSNTRCISNEKNRVSSAPA